jgi:hypothetical protein
MRKSIIAAAAVATLLAGVTTAFAQDPATGAAGGAAAGAATGAVVGGPVGAAVGAGVGAATGAAAGAAGAETGRVHVQGTTGVTERTCVDTPSSSHCTEVRR